ncbi:hypothetical protein [Streptomyces sp. AN091965]|uniref:hypothetical protein n=1 Tax=Streptomyces sp. AN091965 TaxID=2927803 RepID=UPI0027E553F3|nr:hypothetical protein [Streptomyces sp. AN091965]
MGTVWHARDEQLERDVAVKELRLPETLYAAVEGHAPFAGTAPSAALVAVVTEPLITAVRLRLVLRPLRDVRRALLVPTVGFVGLQRAQHVDHRYPVRSDERVVHLAFSVNGPRGGELPGRRVDNLTLTGGVRLPVVHYSYGADAWRCLLHEHGFTATHVLPVEGPDTSPYRTLVTRARRSGT